LILLEEVEGLKIPGGGEHHLSPGYLFEGALSLDSGDAPGFNRNVIFPEEGR